MMDKSIIEDLSAAGKQQGGTPVRRGLAPAVDPTKEKAMQLAIQAKHVCADDLFTLAARIERFLRGLSGDRDGTIESFALLKRAEYFSSPAQWVEFSEQNFSAACQLIGDMASYIKGE